MGEIERMREIEKKRERERGRENAMLKDRKIDLVYINNRGSRNVLCHRNN